MKKQNEESRNKKSATAHIISSSFTLRFVKLILGDSDYTITCMIANYILKYFMF